MTPAQAVDVQVANDRDVKAGIRKALREAGVSLDELQHQAAISHFSSERARMAWFMISPLLEHR
jgi:hypothetical protein